MSTGSYKQLEKESLLDRWLKREKRPEPANGLEPRPEGVLIPLSYGQQRLLFLQQLYPENPFYNYADAYRFKGNLDVDSFIKSFEISARKHEILRTNFTLKDGKAVQHINDLPDFEVFRLDLRDLPEEERFEKARKIAVEKASKPFNLSAGALTRITILQLGEKDFLVVLTMHHIIIDKWSMGVLLSEIAETYQGLKKDGTFEYRPLEIQYADYAYRQNKQAIDEEALAYWREKLKDSLEFLDLPTDFPRPARPTFRGAYSTREFSAELTASLRELAKKQNTTLYVLLLTAYKILLKRYTNETDILVGSPFTNRDQFKLEGLIGFFIDTLVLRSDLSEDPTFLELLEQVKQTTQEAFMHKNMPFEVLVKTLKPERFLNYNPVFQVMFIYHDTPKLPSFDEDLTLEHTPFDLGVTKFDLTLYISDEQDSMSGIFEYSKDLFDEKTIERMHVHFGNLLEAITKHPEQKISELSLLGDGENDLFDRWNETTTDVKSENIIELFKKQVETKSGQKAVSFQNESMTYGELDERANSIANYLLEQNLDRGNPVGLLVESSLEMIIGIFGILKAGFPYLPIDAAYPHERIEYILDNSGSAIVLTNKDQAEKLSGGNVRTGLIEDIISAENSQEPNLKEALKKEDLVYIIYTSGSTGKPKGVAVTHENLVSSTSARFDFYQEDPTSFLLLSSFSFDSSLVGIFWTLATGGKLVLTEKRIEQDLERLAEILQTEKITHTLVLPTLYKALLENIPPEKFESLKVVIVAGEACYASVREKHFETLPGTKLYNEYGPTEATVWATAYEIKALDSDKNIPIGKPVSNTQVYILDENKNRVPVGVAGELYIGGKGVAQGYFNEPKLTEKYFVPNPFDESEIIYRTGDLGRFRPDGTVEFLGRIDEQVKIRGYRIEPGEIQACLKQIPHIKEAYIKVEAVQKNDYKPDQTALLLRYLKGLNIKETEEILSSIEKLSDKEIELMLDETERI